MRAGGREGWRVFKAAEPDAKGNALYVHVMLPAVPGFDYRPSLLLDELVKELAPDLLSKYQDAFALPPTKLNLTEFANMAVAPLPLPGKKTGRAVAGQPGHQAIRISDCRRRRSADRRCASASPAA